MPQGWITRVDKDTGWVTSGGVERAFRHWALAPEMGGRFPNVGDYVQYREVADATRGGYLTEVRKLTPPPAAFTGRHQNVYRDNPQQDAGIKRVVEGEKVPLDAALQTEETTTTGIKRVVVRPTGPLHQPVGTEWALPATTTTTAPEVATATTTTERT